MIALSFLSATMLVAGITVDYPAAGAVFPPEFPTPTFMWRDASPAARVWLIEAESGPARIRDVSTGPRPRLGPVDPRAAAPTNSPPSFTPQQAAARTWKPDSADWAALQRAARGPSRFRNLRRPGGRAHLL